MSLDFDTTKIKDHKEQCWKKDEHGVFSLRPVTDCLVWYTMIIGMNDITEKNYVDFYRRMRFSDAVTSPLLIEGGKKRSLTLAEVKAHIGLHTNATLIPRVSFLAKSFEVFVDNLSIKE